MPLENEDPKKKAGDLKDPLYLLPTEPLRAAARVLKSGADKYGVYNWRSSKLLLITTYVGAILRHLYLFIDGEDADEESGESHLAHIIATCCILMDAARVNKLKDDRPKIEPQGMTDGQIEEMKKRGLPLKPAMFPEGDSYFRIPCPECRNAYLYKIKDGEDQIECFGCQASICVKL